MAQFNSLNHWRNTARPVRFFNVDARAGVFVLLCLMHLRLWTIGLAVCAMVAFMILERFGLTLPLAFRRLRVWFLGPRRPALLKMHHRKFIDYGGF